MGGGGPLCTSGRSAKELGVPVRLKLPLSQFEIFVWAQCPPTTKEYDGTAKRCCICIPGRACVERFVDLHVANDKMFINVAAIFHQQPMRRCSPCMSTSIMLLSWQNN